MPNEQWWPSPYGSDDQIGMLNEITPEKVVAATRLVQRGAHYDLSRVLDQDVPAFPGRTFRQQMLTSQHLLNLRRPDAGPAGWGENNLNFIIETISSTSQMGTHLDALNHLQIGDRFYNGYRLGEIIEEWGTNRLGIETTPQIITRGVLINVAAVRGVARLGPGDVITIQDVQQALAHTGVAIERGDAALFHTGWGDLWMQDNAAYLAGEPGPGMELALWLVEQGVCLSGCDTWSYGPVPPEDDRQRFIVPQTLNVRHGLFIVENLYTAELARDSVVAFLFVLTHARVRGATGAWVSPVAVT
ncbi:MAG: cyclase family protein [Chloroflexales bacterium]|nr:cyclase family protein [Chloroflexales bacterium]